MSHFFPEHKTKGSLGARLSRRLGIVTSWMTILRRIMSMPGETSAMVTALGIDDFSFRRGRKFGTILVDLSAHQIVDLLPERKVESAAAWMRSHPEIQYVSRDRGQDYAQCGFRKGLAVISRKFCRGIEHKHVLTKPRLSREVLQ